MANIPKVTVLLATFNGVSFLEEQLTSLNEQQDVDLEVFVNDDGSTDGTLDILETWRTKGLIASITESNNCGSTKAFLRLLQKCGEKQFVAFCDQDDFWEPGKLATQVQLCEQEVPTLVFSRRKFMNSSAETIGVSPKFKKGPSFGNALIENIAPGNTLLLNSPAITIVNSHFSPDTAHYDSWMYLLISAFGKCMLIDEPLVRYRIHENNQVGLRKFRIGNLELSALHFIHQAAYLSKQRKQTLSKEKMVLLTDFISVLHVLGKRQKVKAVLKTKFDRQRLFDRIAFKLTFLVLVIKGKI
jgi:glycosyltransferase involved in cell wall biosynthesis